MIKTLALSIVFAVGLSSPALAQTGPNPPANVSADVIDESLILEATTLQDRAAMLRRCAGPPPRPMAQTEPATSEPAKTPETSEPAAIVERATTGSTGG